LPVTPKRPAPTGRPRTTRTTPPSSRRATSSYTPRWTPSPTPGPGPGTPAIVIVTDENDFTGNSETGGWESADGCCDSPYVAKGDTGVNAAWPGGTYGGGLIPAIVITGSGPQHVVSHTPYNHYSLLTTIEDNWQLGHLGHAGDTGNGVQPMWDLFTPHH